MVHTSTLSQLPQIVDSGGELSRYSWYVFFDTCSGKDLRYNLCNYRAVSNDPENYCKATMIIGAQAQVGSHKPMP